MAEYRPVTQGDVTVIIDGEIIPYVRSVSVRHDNDIVTKQPMEVALGLYTIEVSFDVFHGRTVKNYNNLNVFITQVAFPFATYSYEECQPITVQYESTLDRTTVYLKICSSRRLTE